LPTINAFNAGFFSAIEPQTMPSPEEQVDRIVSQVLARLGGTAGFVAPESKTPALAPAGELILNDHVVSAASLLNQLGGVQRVVVSARSVVTPAARDLLKEKNVILVRTLQSTMRGNARLVMAATSARFDSNGLVRALAQRNVHVQLIAAIGLTEVIRHLTVEIGEHEKLGVLLTDRVAAALCLANRQRGVRAAAVANRGELNEALREIGANLLVVDISRRSMLEAQRIAEAFSAAPAQQCPAEFKAVLE
jgi:hypothetical protein